MEIYKNLSLENIENEIWLPIEGYENYQVSNLGRVKSLGNDKLRKEKILRQGKNHKGYLYVNLYKDGKSKVLQVHRLVATAFIPNTNNFRCVNHKNEIKTDNFVSNLEWCTYQYNNTYGTCIQRRVSNTDYKARTAHTDYKARTAKMDYQAIGKKNAEKLTNRQDLSKKVFQYSLDGTLVAIHHSTRECERNGYTQSAVSACCRGEAKSHKGYIWSYTELI